MFQDISYLELSWSSFSAARNHLCNLAEGIFFEFGPGVQELSFQDISYLYF